MFKPQLSEDTVNLKEPLRFPVLASVKFDGIRAVSKFGSLLSRSLKPIPNNHIRELLSQYPDLDGEIIYGDPTDNAVRRLTNSAVRSIQGEPSVKYYVFDDLSTDGTFEQRLAILNARTLPDFIVKVEQRLVESQADLDAFYAQVLEEGHEGLILRNPKSKYFHGRCSLKSQDSLKLKPFEDSEIQVTEVFEAMHNTNQSFTNELGRTARSSSQDGLVGNGMIGGFFGRDLKTGQTIKVAAGKLNHGERKWIFENSKSVIGKILTYRHMPVNVKDAPNFARFISWREKFDMGE
jgi:DNA ligase-1